MPVAPSTSATMHRGIEPGFKVREAPAPSPWVSTELGPPVPDERPEPVLAMANIQGNGLAGFNKSFQTLLCFHIDDAQKFKPVIAELSHLVATAEEVLAFNRLYKQVRDRRGHSGTLRSAWINVAFSFRGLSKLGPPHVELFADRSFRSGLVGRWKDLQDPVPPDQWKINDGDAKNAADVLIIVAADTKEDLKAEVQRVTDLIGNNKGARPVRTEMGENLPDKLVGHEHFGFLDGISQPGLRGRASELPTDLLTPRLNPQDRSQGKPGQELIWPGEFVFGYPDQDGSRDGNERGGDSTLDGAGYPVVPKWAKDGSYLVFRRLEQKVSRFHEFLRAQKAEDETAQAFAARLVGRWPSGAPLTRTRGVDDPTLADNDCANNHFAFIEATDPIAKGLANHCPLDRFPRAQADPLGELCPRNAHIRKVNPRDEVNAAVRRRHRLLRRGIPFGPPSASTIDLPAEDKDGSERGLLFLAYMTSIEDQFEFVMRDWVNGADFPGERAGGDALLAHASGNRWVVPTGGGYYFAPSVFALRAVLSK